MESNDALFKEISLNKTRTDATFAIKAIGGGKIKHETLLYNLNRVINQSDISFIDYTDGGTQTNNPLEPLNELFSDNIVVYYPIDDTLIKNIEKLKIKNPDDTKDTDADDQTIDNSVLNKIAKDLLGSTTATIKRVLNQLDIDIRKPDIKPIGIKSADGFAYRPSSFVQLLKVNLSNVSIDSIFNLLGDSTKIEFLHENLVYIHDIDFTRDYKGVFNKRDVIRHLVGEHDFIKQGDTNPDDNPVIINNSQLVSNNCLTFISSSTTGTIRYKFYNKFVQSMESPSVRNKIGSHINDWINNPEPILRKAIENSLETGILRLEFTMYLYKNTTGTLDRDVVYANMEYLENLMPPNLIYFNSIENQFNLLCKNILYNVCIVDLELDLAFVALYHNKLTGKVNGFYIEKINATKLSNALRWYCSNKPITVVLMQIDPHNDEVNIQQDSYLRINTASEPLYTYIHKGCEKLKAVQTKDNINKPGDVGLTPNNVFNFVFPTSTASLLKSSTREKIMFKMLELELLNYPNETLTIRSINRDIKEETEENAFKEHYEQQINNIKSKNEVIEAQIEECAHKEMVRDMLYKVLSNIRAYTHRFLDLKDGTEINVYGFKETRTRYGKTYLLACSLNVMHDVYGNLIEYMVPQTILQLYWCPSNIAHYIDKILANKGFKQLDIKRITAYGSLTGIPIMQLIKEGSFTNASKNLCAKMVVKECKNNETEDITGYRDNIMQEVDANIKQCRKIDESVKLGDIIKVTGYKLLKSSLLIRCSINGGDPKDYIATYWLKEIILDKLKYTKITNCIEAVVGPTKTSPQKQKCYIYVVS